MLSKDVGFFLGWTERGASLDVLSRDEGDRVDGSRELTRVRGWACIMVWARGWLEDEAFWSAGVMVGLEGFEGFLLLKIIHSP